jgi:hypothetical protein
MTKHTFVLTLFVLTVFWTFARSLGQGGPQSTDLGPTQTKVLSVHYPRPLAEGAKFLEKYLSVAVSYEDPPWSFAPDIERNGDSPNRVPTMIDDTRGPVWGTLELQFTIRTETSRAIDTPRILLDKLLAEHVLRKNAGEFRIVESGDGFALIPVRCSDREGKLASCGSPLDSVISFPEEERDARATVRLILQTVKSATGHSIVLGDNLTVPPSYVFGGRVTLGAKNEAARDVLAKAFKQIRYSDPATLPVKTAWSMLYDPGDRVYVLNLREVAR